MAFFDKLGDIAKTATDKAGDAVDIAKMNSKISGEEKNIAVAISKIGEFYLKKMEAGEELAPEVMEFYQKILDSRNAIEDLKSQITALKAH